MDNIKEKTIQFKKTNRDKYLSTCCGKQKMKIVYDCENDNP